MPDQNRPCQSVEFFPDPVRKEIEQQERTIADLKANGHECPDAERHLQRLKYGGVLPAL